MTTVGFVPVELPTNRQSRADLPLPNIHDPNYIPLLHGSDIDLDFSLPPLSQFSPTPPLTPIMSQADMLKRSKSASAPERVDITLESLPRTPNPSTQTSHLPEDRSQKRKSDDDQLTLDSEGTSTARTSAPSTIGSISISDDQVYTIPGNLMPAKDNMGFPPVPVSTRSSLSMNRKSAVPTSKYSRKPLPGVPATIPCSPINKPQSPRQSPQISPVPITSEFSVPAPPTEPRASTPKIRPAKSTASTKRERGLHSHSSYISNKSQRNSSDLDPEEVSIRSPAPHRHRNKSGDSSKSRGIIYDSQPNSPAPTTPLPDLPAHVKRPSTRERASAAGFQYATSPTSTFASPRTQNDHFEMASFMTTTSTVVFRRFDEVHVRLLLQLQDEIAGLEKELLELDSPAYNKPDKIPRKMSVMRDLRQLLAEYDHLFANWSSMQTHKAGSGVREELEKWLQNPAAGSEAITSGARQDIAWLKECNDLSMVNMQPEREIQKETSPPSINSNQSKSTGSGFKAFFGCAGKRK